MASTSMLGGTICSFMYDLDIPFCSGAEAFLADLTIRFNNQVLHITEEKKRPVTMLNG